MENRMDENLKKEIENRRTFAIISHPDAGKTTEDMRMTQETKTTLAKNRFGSLIVEPVVTTFNPTVMVVGELISKVEYQDDFTDLNAGGFDDFTMDDF